MSKTPASTFNRLKKGLRAAIDGGDTAKVVLAVMRLGEHANAAPEDWKMSPRTFYEMTDVLRQMRNDGQITDSGQAQILELLRGGSNT